MILTVEFRWSAALPSLLGTRLLLHMREVVEKQADATYLVESFALEEPAPEQMEATPA